jgi:hypothetical protein
VRRWPLSTLLAVLLLVALVAAPPAAADRYAQRARATETALERGFRARDGLYVNRFPRGSHAHAWAFSQAVAAAISIAALPDATPAERQRATRRVVQLERYRGPLGYRSWRRGDTYVDDNEWIALDLLDWYAQSHQRVALARALRAFALAVTGWDARPGRPCPGGVLWARASANHDRNTVTTATGALLGLRLHALLHRSELLWWSARMLNWLDGCLRSPSGLYWDHVRANGSIDQTFWSYNQGSVIAADGLLYKLTNDATALARAKSLADASLSYLKPASREPPAFVALLSRDLLGLGGALDTSRYRAAVEAYADAAWRRHRDPRTGLFNFRGATTLLNVAAMVQIYAALAADPAPERR